MRSLSSWIGFLCSASLCLATVHGQSHGRFVIVGQNTPTFRPAAAYVDPCGSMTALTINGIGGRITGLCRKSSTGEIFASSGNAVYAITLNGTTLNATWWCDVPAHMENDNIFMGARGLPCVSQRDGGMYECPQNGPAINLVPGATWISLDCGGYDPLTGDYLAVGDTAPGKCLFRIRNGTLNPIGVPSAFGLRPTKVFTNGAGGAWVSAGDLYEILSNGMFLMRVQR